MIPASQPARRPSELHIFKVYYPDLFGGTLSVIRDICAGLKDIFPAGVLVCSRTGGKSRIAVNDVADAINTLIADPETASADGPGRTPARHHEIFHDSLQGGS